MKFNRLRPPSYHAGPNLTPLVDVVMVVLIFLMLAGSFGCAQHFLKARAADGGSASSVPPPTPTILHEMIDVVMWRGPGGSFAAQAGDVRAGAAATLGAGLAEKRRLYAANGTPAEDIRVVIRPAADVPYEHVAAAFEAVLKAGYEHVAFATSE